MKARELEGLPPLAADDPRHGTPNGYNNLGCRCRPCTKANSDYNRERNHATGRKRPIAEMRKPLTGPDDPRHGTAGAWSDRKCRCDKCRDFARKAQADYRRRRAARDAAEMSSE